MNYMLTMRVLQLKNYSYNEYTILKKKMQNISRCLDFTHINFKSLEIRQLNYTKFIINNYHLYN